MDLKAFATSSPSSPSPSPSRSFLAFSLFLLAIATLLTLAASLFYYFFFLSTPLDPSLRITSIRLLSLSPAGFRSSITSVNLTLLAALALHNPNSGPFRIGRGSSASLYYYGERVGVRWMGETTVEGRSSVAMELELSVEGPTPLQGAKLSDDVERGVLQSGVSVQVRGEVRPSSPAMASIFSSRIAGHGDHHHHHRHLLAAACSVNVSLSSKGIDAYACQGSVPVMEEEEDD